MVVKDTQEMITRMDPIRVPGLWQFATLPNDDPRLERLLPDALAMMREDKGVTLILPDPRGESPLPMAQITLQVASALDGVGLTAAVAKVLADAGFPCNVIAGYHHDHVFLPDAVADEALALLKQRAAL